jgi:hypothetical protein
VQDNDVLCLSSKGRFFLASMLKKTANFVLGRLYTSTYLPVRLGAQTPCGRVGSLFEHAEEVWE